MDILKDARHTTISLDGTAPDFSGEGVVKVWPCKCGKGYRIEIQDQNGQCAGTDAHFPSENVALATARSFLDSHVRSGVYIVGSEPTLPN
jgi:hypothetical protein